MVLDKKNIVQKEKVTQILFENETHYVCFQLKDSITTCIEKKSQFLEGIEPSSNKTAYHPIKWGFTENSVLAFDW